MVSFVGLASGRRRDVVGSVASAGIVACGASVVAHRSVPREASALNDHSVHSSGGPTQLACLHIF